MIARRAELAPRRAASAALLLGLAGCSAAAPGPPRASDVYEKCTSVEALEAARAAVARGSYGEALPHLQRVLADCPQHVATHMLYQDTARDAGAEAEAAMRAYYEQADDGESPVWPYARARLAKHAATQLDLLQEALRRDRSFYWAYLSEARIRRSNDQPDKALEALEQALAARPDFAEARLERAEVLVELGRHEEAEREFANYLRLRPNDRQVIRGYAMLLIYGLGRAEQAESYVREMLEDDPGDVATIMNMAAIDWRVGRPQQAIARYHDVLELEPSEMRAALNLGNLYSELSGQAASARRENLIKARNAYLYYLAISKGRNEDRYDYWDHYLSVPYRLRTIEAEVGAYAGTGTPALSEF